MNVEPKYPAITFLSAF